MSSLPQEIDPKETSVGTSEIDANPSVELMVTVDNPIVATENEGVPETSNYSIPKSILDQETSSDKPMDDIHTGNTTESEYNSPSAIQQTTSNQSNEPPQGTKDTSIMKGKGLSMKAKALRQLCGDAEYFITKGGKQKRIGRDRTKIKRTFFAEYVEEASTSRREKPRKKAHIAVEQDAIEKEAIDETHADNNNIDMNTEQDTERFDKEPQEQQVSKRGRKKSSVKDTKKVTNNKKKNGFKNKDVKVTTKNSKKMKANKNSIEEKVGEPKNSVGETQIETADEYETSNTGKNSSNIMSSESTPEYLSSPLSLIDGYNDDSGSFFENFLVKSKTKPEKQSKKKTSGDKKAIKKQVKNKKNINKDLKEDHEKSQEIENEQVNSVKKSHKPGKTEISPELKKHKQFMDYFSSFGSPTGPSKMEIVLGTRQLFTNEVNASCATLAKPIDFINNIDFIRQFKDNYREHFEVEDETELVIDLDNPLFIQRKEKFLLLAPRDEELDPFHELGRTMVIMSQIFFPDQRQLEVMNRDQPHNCIIGFYAQAALEKNLKKVKESVAMFNLLIKQLSIQDVILPFIKSKKTISRDAIHGLLNQIYSRTVSPVSKNLRRYQAFSNTVYGEILPKFFSKMLSDVGANSNMRFLDLGSGVGNCVFQAALEYGCDSYGVEIMEQASAACESQEREFLQRSKYYGLDHGKVTFFLRQSFVDNEPVKKIVENIDIVLVNNYVFEPKLNDLVGLLLNNLKPGSKIISLKDFKSTAGTVDAYNSASIFHKFIVERYQFEEDSVSWTNSGGTYFIGTVTDKYPDHVWQEHYLTRTRSQLAKK